MQELGNTDIKTNNYQNSILYNILMGLIVRDSIATIPSNILKTIGFELLEVIATYLIKMRKNGLYIIKIISLEPLKYEELKISSLNENEDFYNNKEYLVFGDIKNKNKGQFILNEKQQQLICSYDEVFSNMYQINKAVSLWYMQIKDFGERVKNPVEKKALFSQVKNLLNRNNSNLTILDKDDNIKLLEASNSNVMINEVKEAISTTFGIPFSKLFKGTSSGFNNLDKNDLENWNFEIRFFQGVYIMPLIKKIYEYKNLENEFKNLELEPILFENKQIEEELKSQKIENIIKLRAMNLITINQATSLINEIYNLKEE